MADKFLDPKDKVVIENLQKLIQGPDDAQYYLWLAQAQRDHSIISDKHMSQVETIAGPTAKKSRVLYNPFTGEIRREFINKE